MVVKAEELAADFTFNDLLKAYYDCRKRKRNTLSALQFEVQLEKNLLDLYHDLKNGTYKIGRYICFVVVAPKPREVWAANFRDRIVHHLIYNAVKDRFHKRFIQDTYSCIPKRGTLACAKKMLHYARSASRNYTKKVYFLKADLSNFFVSIDKKILFDLLAENIPEKWILDLLKQIIYHDPKSNVFVKSDKKLFTMLPYHKSLWHNPSSHGLPIGNLTSQFFSNVYLNALDQYVKHHLRCKFYCRYVDDFVILSASPVELEKYCRLISSFLYDVLKIKLNPKKCFINSAVKGIDFVGYFIMPQRMLLRKRTIGKLFAALKRWKNSYNRFEASVMGAFFMTINSYLGMMRHTASFNLRFAVCSRFNSLFLTHNIALSKAVLM